MKKIRSNRRRFLAQASALASLSPRSPLSATQVFGKETVSKEKYAFQLITPESDEVLRKMIRSYIPEEYYDEYKKYGNFLCCFDHCQLEGDLNLDDRSLSAWLKRFRCPLGTMVLKLNNIQDDGNEIISPARAAGISIGDTITAINGMPVSTRAEWDSAISASQEEKVMVQYVHTGMLKTATVHRYHNPDGRLMLGVNTRFFLEKDISLEGIYFKGNLTLTGSLANLNSDAGVDCVINGNLKAKNLISGGSFVYVKGDVSVEDAVVGHYNDGILAIDGKIKARCVVNSDHCMDIDTKNIEGDFISDMKETKYSAGEYFSPAFYDKEGEYFEIDKLNEALVAGKPYLNPNFKRH